MDLQLTGNLDAVGGSAAGVDNTESGSSIDGGSVLVSSPKLVRIGLIALSVDLVVALVPAACPTREREKRWKYCHLVLP